MLTEDMKEFCIEIAGKSLQIRTAYKETEKQCEKYLTSREPELTVALTAEDIARMRKQAEREDMLEGKVPRVYSDAYLETLAMYRKICEKMVEYDTILMHGSVVAVDNQAYLFTAKSGTGKSTHTRYWRAVFGERAIMVNDDKPLLKLTEEGILACGTPWDGKHRLSTNVCLPLKGICILERGEENEIHPITAQEALPMVFQQTHRPKNMGKYMEIIDKLTRRVKFYRLRCNQTPAAAKIAYEVMK